MRDIYELEAAQFGTFCIWGRVPESRAVMNVLALDAVQLMLISNETENKKGGQTLAFVSKMSSILDISGLKNLETSKIIKFHN